MPIDFNRVPPKVDVPPAPRLSILAWLLLFVLIMGAGATLTILLWPTGWPTNTLLFGLCVAGLPFVAFTVLLLARLGYGYACRNEAIVTNKVSERIEQDCHDRASRPLAVLGHAWCFSSDMKENTVDSVLGGGLRMEPRPSATVGDKQVLARWLVLPNVTFSPGNELSEYARQQAVITWLLARLLERLASTLTSLPRDTRLLAELSVFPVGHVGAVEAQLREYAAARAPGLKIDVKRTEEAVSLFRVDGWCDRRDPQSPRLLIAIELRNAISALLSDGVAEAGVALLVGHPQLSSSVPSRLCLHRPASGALDETATTLALAARWGRTALEKLSAVWSHGLHLDQIGAVRQGSAFTDHTPWFPLETSVGDCSSVGPWLTLALAAENAQTTGEPQLVLCREGDDVLALVCKKKT
ncbi:hypothetical protein AB4Y45_37565 [Paraburkholderia sp. EG287A]|uniref:hypothetical protein n=1 Tax=unclassified Paraburkholderia TaxID=2615204 RepID=UPI0034D383F2